MIMNTKLVLRTTHQAIAPRAVRNCFLFVAIALATVAPMANAQSNTFVTGMNSPASYTSYQVNVDSFGNNIPGDAANESSIAVDPNNPSKMAIAFRQYPDTFGNNRKPGYAYSSNGGTSWTFPGLLADTFGSNPVAASDDHGNFFYLSLFYDGAQQMNNNMWRSLDSGATWAKIGNATGGSKPWFTIDKTPSSTGYTFQYECWSPGNGSLTGNRQFSRSMDGGFTWMDAILIPNAPEYGTPDVDTNGNLFIGGVNTTTNQAWCVRSSSAKRRTGTVKFEQSTALSLGGNIVMQPAINPAGFAGQVFLAVDRSGATTNNNVYMLASVLPTGAASTSGTDVMFVRSTDAGSTFSSPRRINDDPVNPSKWHWFGAMSVAPNGRIDAVWLDSRNAANNTDSQLYYSYSRDGGNSWSANVAVSNPFNPFLGYPGANNIGHYLTIVSDNGGGNVAYPATFNGEQDVYYVRVLPTPMPNYSLSISPSTQSVPRGGGTLSYTVTVTPMDGFVSPVSLSVSGLPSGATPTFSPNPATPGGYATLTVTLSSSASQGTYPFTVTGNGGSPAITRTAKATLIKTK
jgi:hypothetical protein